VSGDQNAVKEYSHKTVFKSIEDFTSEASGRGTQKAFRIIGVLDDRQRLFTMAHNIQNSFV
jgi:AAA15 family ATPase/GTPase